MKHEMLKALDDVAAQTHTTPEQARQMLLAQAKVQGTTNLIWMVIVSLMLIACVWLSIYLCRKYGKEIERIQTVTTLATALVGVIWLIVVGSSIHETITCFTNPEYWVWSNLRHLIGPPWTITLGK